MWEFCVTVFMGFVGTIIDLLFFNMMGNFGIILAVATMGSFILNRIGRNAPADENTGYNQNETELEQDELNPEEPEPEDMEQDESDNNTDHI